MPKTKALTEEEGAMLRERAEIVAFLDQLRSVVVDRSQRLRDIEMFLQGAKVAPDTEPPPAPPEPPANRAEARRQERAEKRAKVLADAEARKAATAAKKAPAKKATKRPAKKAAAKAGRGGTS